MLQTLAPGLNRATTYQMYSAGVYVRTAYSLAIICTAANARGKTTAHWALEKIGTVGISARICGFATPIGLPELEEGCLLRFQGCAGGLI